MRAFRKKMGVKEQKSYHEILQDSAKIEKKRGESYYNHYLRSSDFRKDKAKRYDYGLAHSGWSKKKVGKRIKLNKNNAKKETMSK